MVAAITRLYAGGCHNHPATNRSLLFEGGAEVADHAELGEDDRAFRWRPPGPAIT
jgi:hypothetical protein